MNIIYYGISLVYGAAAVRVISTKSEPPVHYVIAAMRYGTNIINFKWSVGTILRNFGFRFYDVDSSIYVIAICSNSGPRGFKISVSQAGLKRLQNCLLNVNCTCAEKWSVGSFRAACV